MSRRTVNIQNIIKTDKLVHPNPDNLWCNRCQRGITGHEEYKDLKAGDDCPFCEILSMDGEIAHEARGVLKTCQTVTDEYLELAKMKHRVDQLKQVRSIKDTGDVALARVTEQDRIIEKLRQQIEAMDAKNSKPVGVVKPASDEPDVSKPVKTTKEKTGSK